MLLFPYLSIFLIPSPLLFLSSLFLSLLLLFLPLSLSFPLFISLPLNHFSHLIFHIQTSSLSNTCIHNLNINWGPMWPIFCTASRINEHSSVAKSNFTFMSISLNLFKNSNRIQFKFRRQTLWNPSLSLLPFPTWQLLWGLPVAKPTKLSTLCPEDIPQPPALHLLPLLT